MSKYVKKVAEVVHRAMQNGQARDYPYDATYKDGVLELSHYNTLIVAVSSGGVEYLGGYSLSDADAIDTAIHAFGGNGGQTTRSERTAKRIGAMPIRGSSIYTTATINKSPKKDYWG